MQADYGAQEDTPHHISPAAHGKNDHRKCGQGDPVPLADPEHKPVFAEFRNIGQKQSWVVVQGLARNDPANVRPESAVTRRMRVAGLVRVLMMDAVGRDPTDGSTLQSKGAQIVSEYSTHLGVL